MDKLLIIVLLFIQANLHGQSEPCKHFRLQIENERYKGKKATYINPQITVIPNDTISYFINKYRNRFEYILLNKIDSIAKFAKYTSDTPKLYSEFCKYLEQNEKFNEYINILLNKNQRKIEFTERQMMKIASRFFLCDKVNEKDTSVSYHICIGINGQNELKSDIDYTVLEAFCFEAIFDAITNQNKPKFIEAFRNYLSQSIERHKPKFRTKKEFLETVKTECFLAMENNYELREHLTQYYNDNQTNIGITLK